MSEKHEFAVGQRVFVSGGVSRTPRSDVIVRETATRWICESGKWFDKKTERGPRPKSGFASPEYLKPGTDRILVREVTQEELRTVLFRLERSVKAERIVDVAAVRTAIAEIGKLLDRLDSGAA